MNRAILCKYLHQVLQSELQCAFISLVQHNMSFSITVKEIEIQAMCKSVTPRALCGAKKQEKGIFLKDNQLKYEVVPDKVDIKHHCTIIKLAQDHIAVLFLSWTTKVQRPGTDFILFRCHFKNI